MGEGEYGKREETRDAKKGMNTPCSTSQAMGRYQSTCLNIRCLS